MVQASLLNRVYDVQRDKERQFNLISQMMKMSVSPDQPMDGNRCQTQGAGGQVQQEMEVASNPAYSAYMLERALLEDNNGNPHSQLVKRHDPVYLSSMATHGVWHHQHAQAEHQEQQKLELQYHQGQQLELQYHQQQQLELQHQQQLELQQRSCENQGLAEQLGGFVSPINRPDLIPLMDSMQIE